MPFKRTGALELFLKYKHVTIYNYCIKFYKSTYQSKPQDTSDVDKNLESYMNDFCVDLGPF